MRSNEMRRSVHLISTYCFFITLFTALLMSVGCVSTETVKKPVGGSVPLVITKSGDMANMQWESKRGYYYTVMYASSRSSRSVWKPLPRCIRIPGTGAHISVTDHFRVGETRHYRLHIEP